MTNDTNPTWDGAPAVRDAAGDLWLRRDDGLYEYDMLGLVGGVLLEPLTASELERKFGPGEGLYPRGELGLTVNEDGSLINWLGENYVRQPKPDPDTITAAWRRGDDDAAWREVLRVAAMEGARVTVEYDGVVTTGPVLKVKSGHIELGLEKGYLFGVMADTDTDLIAVTAPGPKEALVEQLEADGWAWAEWTNGGASSYQLIDGAWYPDGDERFTAYSTAELLSIHPTIARHPAFIAGVGSVKGGGDQ